jgi:DNA repair exonuclease SbcCD nuclease subunit
MKKMCCLSLNFIIIVLALLSLFSVYNYWVIGHETENFTLIVLPDTQKYSEEYTEIFSNQTRWIVKNQERMNIGYVVHEGDIVDNSEIIDEWEVASAAMKILDEANIPYSIAPGNHDLAEDGSLKNYNNFFGKKRFVNRSWYGGDFNGYANNYNLVNIKGREFIFLNLKVCPSEDEIEFANRVFQEYPDRFGVLTTHGYLNKKAERNVYFCNDMTYLWDDLIRKHENLRIVLSGHIHDEARRVDLNDYGKEVHQILANYQNSENGGNGFLRIMEFDFGEDLVYIKTFSPYLNEFLTKEDSEFVISIE